MTRLNQHGTELARMEFADCRIAIMSDGSVLRNQGAGWKAWKRVKAGADPVAYAARALSAYEARPAELHTYIKALAAACDLAHRGQLNALVTQLPEDPDAVLALIDDPRYEIGIEDVALCCRARMALDVARPALGRAA